MTITNEPGYYEEATEGKKGFGVRHENVLLVVKKETEHPPFQNRKFLGFERLTYVPFQTKMLDLTLLRPDEVNMCQMMFMWLSLVAVVVFGPVFDFAFVHVFVVVLVAVVVCVLVF